MAVPAADGTAEHAGTPSSCDLALALGRESDTRLLFNGAGDGQAEPLPGTAVLVWAPRPSAGRATALAFPFAAGPQPDLTCGFLAGALEFLELARGPLRTLRLLESSAPAHCCGSDQLVELATEELVLRATLHRPAPEAGEDLRRLRTTYSPREASDWAVCEWNSRSLDPLEAAGILIVDAGLAGGPSPNVYVLWQDVDAVPRAWEAFAELPEPGLLQAALSDHFRYVARDEELLVLDRSPIRPLGRRAALTEELVHTKPFARPPLPKTPG